MFKQDLLILSYNKDVVCVIDEGRQPVCEMLPNARRRSGIPTTVPTHDPYIPRANPVFYNCTSVICEPFHLESVTQITSPNLTIKTCFAENENYKCEALRYNYLKNVDKLLLLSTNIPNKIFYLVDCFVYADEVRVCQRKEGNRRDAHNSLVDLGTIIRPEEPNILSQDEFLCEENVDKEVNCDLIPFVPYDDELREKSIYPSKMDVLLKSGTFLIPLSYGCSGDWCGYRGKLQTSRRAEPYSPPGGKTFRCYYAKGEQVCKQISS